MHDLTALKTESRFLFVYILGILVNKGLWKTVYMGTTGCSVKFCNISMLNSKRSGELEVTKVVGDI